jgi:hypothetical protein
MDDQTSSGGGRFRIGLIIGLATGGLLGGLAGAQIAAPSAAAPAQPMGALYPHLQDPGSNDDAVAARAPPLPPPALPVLPPAPDVTPTGEDWMAAGRAYREKEARAADQALLQSQLDAQQTEADLARQRQFHLERQAIEDSYRIRQLEAEARQHQAAGPR